MFKETFAGINESNLATEYNNYLENNFGNQNQEKPISPN